MLLVRQIGCYNVTIRNGVLDYNNYWHYELYIEKVNREKDYIIERKLFYIEGHKEYNEKQRVKMITEVYKWHKYVNEREIDEVFSHSKHYKFNMMVPRKCRLA